MLTHVEVTDEHIRAGHPDHCGLCPVALATKPSIVNGFRIEVYSTCFNIIRLGGITVFQANLPSEARRFIRRFDKGESVKPLALELDIPDEFLAKSTETS